MAEDNDRERTFTGGLLGGGKDYETRQREKLVLFLTHFRTREELLVYLEETQKMQATVAAQNILMQNLKDKVDKLTAECTKMKEVQEEILESRERRAWLFGNVKILAQWFLPVAAFLTLIVQGWDKLVEYLRGGQIP